MFMYLWSATPKLHNAMMPASSRTPRAILKWSITGTLICNLKATMMVTFTGHEDYDSLKPYLPITDKTRKNLMTTMFSK